MGHEVAVAVRSVGVSAPRPVARPTTLRRATRATGRSGLTVGAVDDPAERDADRLAADAVRFLRSSPAGVAAHGMGRIHRSTTVATAPEAGPDGGEVGPGMASRIHATTGRGAPLDTGVRAPLEHAFEADFSAVRVHDASALAPELGATAFTLGRDVHFAPGTYAPTTEPGMHLLAHELAHVVQQGGAGAGGPARRSTIYRHASFEHLMLGQVDPLELRSIADERAALRLVAGAQALDLKQSTAYHVLRQERERLRQWQANEPKSLGDVDPNWQVHAVEIASRTPSQDARTTTVCTYGEMNMLADYFGSPDEVYAAEAHTLWKLLQTERAEYYEKLGEMLDELMVRDFVVKQEQKPGKFWGSTTIDVKWYLPENAPEKDQYVPADYTVREGSSRLTQQGFEGDQRYGNATQNLISMSGLEPLMGVGGLLPNDAGLTNMYGPGKGTGTAWGVTARNACHFAPESWRSWETYHREAIELAADAGRMREAASAPGTSDADRERWLARADQYANDAWVRNGFADHYLQDSFASGHLINKTLVMQWYTDEIGTWWTGPSQAVWQRLAMMSAARQPGLGASSYSKAPGVPAQNPQASANATSPGDAWDATGLQSVALSANAKTLLAHLRQAAGRLRTAEEWAESSGLAENVVQPALVELEDNGFVIMNTPEAPRDPIEWRLNAQFTPKAGQQASADPESTARTVTANLYHQWLQNALVQAGSGALHDHFCKQGLWVTTGAGREVFKIYGDDRMLSAGAGDGVQFAAETARLSQENIATVIESGRADQGQRSIPRILDRFPSHVVPEFAPAQDVYKAKDFGLKHFNPPAAAPIPLDQWHTRLHAYMNGTYLKSLFSTWTHHYASQTPGNTDLVPFPLISPHAGSEF